MKNGTLRALGRVVVATAMAIALLVVVPAGPASAANSGTVQCSSGRNVVGVWVEVKGGKSGWASRKKITNSMHTWSYNTQNKPYRLDVGCGGKASKWGSNNKTPSFQKNWVNVFCLDHKGVRAWTCVRA